MTKAKTSCYPWFWHPMWCQINPNNWSPEHLSPNRATISTGLNQTWRLGAGWPPANSALVNLTWWMTIMTIHSLFRRISRIIWQGSPHAMLGGGAGWCFRVRDATLTDWSFDYSPLNTGHYLLPLPYTMTRNGRCSSKPFGRTGHHGQGTWWGAPRDLAQIGMTVNVHTKYIFNFPSRF